MITEQFVYRRMARPSLNPMTCRPSNALASADFCVDTPSRTNSTGISARVLSAIDLPCGLLHLQSLLEACHN